jgi:hypothetical protein
MEREKRMLCLEVWRNNERLTTAGVSETGVLSFILSWAGKEKDASAIAGSSAGTVPGMHCVVGGIDGITSVDWYETQDLKIGDELCVRLISSEIPDPPFRSQTAPRGNPDWIKKAKDSV